MKQPEMLTINEAAKKSGLATYALRRWVKSGDLPTVSTGRKVLIAADNLQRFLLGELDAKSVPEVKSNGIRQLHV